MSPCFTEYCNFHAQRQNLDDGPTGFGLGMLLSLFSFGMAYDTPFGRTLDGKEVSYKKALKDGWHGAVRQGRGFGAVGAAYSVSECIIESVSACLRIEG